MPVVAARRRGGDPPRAKAGEENVGRHPGGDRAHLHDADHDQRDRGAAPQALRQRLEAQRGDDRQDAEQRQRVAQVLVADQLQHDEWCEGRHQQEPLPTHARHDEADRDERHRGQAELVAEQPQVEDQADEREDAGMARLGGLAERARVDLGAEAEQPRPEPGQAQRGGDQRGEGSARQRAAAAAQKQEHGRRRDVECERRLRQQAEPAHDAEERRHAEPVEIAGRQQVLVSKQIARLPDRHRREAPRRRRRARPPAGGRAGRRPPCRDRGSRAV